MDVDALRARLRAPTPLLLDGGLATTLEARGHALEDGLWSARLLLDDEEAIVDAHRAFLASGAEVVTTASYQLAEASLGWSGRDPELAPALLARSVTLARTAIERHLDAAEPEEPHGASALVAASVGPYGAVLADGSEYRGRYGLPTARLVDFHAPRVDALTAAGPDVLACETIPSGVEVAAVVALLAGSPVPAWVSVTIGEDGRRTPEGEPLDEAIGAAAEADAVVAIGVNCCPPRLVDAALDALAAYDLPLVCYPNVGARWDADARAWVPAPADDASTGGISSVVRSWVGTGVRLVGGCCGTGPDDIAALRAALNDDEAG